MNLKFILVYIRFSNQLQNPYADYNIEGLIFLTCWILAIAGKI